MSKTVDSRVVEMRFDNKNFEQNVQTSMSTLDKLKSKLKLNGVTKGIENLGAATKKVNFNPLSQGIETVQAKFSAMQIVGITALQNITNSAINAGKHIASALTIDPIKTGLSEYEQKMNAVQVIQANTRGKNNLDQITQALDDLNTYADKTIYNFAQMTSNIGKFTAQGLDVFQAADAVKGMANLAAASGASAEDMSRATYQMSQALSGTIKLMDWNSLRNANMATMELKNTLIDLAKVHGIAIDDMIAKEGTFEQTLASGWLTGEMFTEAMNIYSGVYSDAELKAKGFTDSQIANFKELAAMAESAATEVKTFTQLWDVLKETAQSGWAQTWELIFGDFNESKKLFTQLQIFFSGIIDKWSNARNTFLGGVMNISKPWSAIVDKLNGSGLGKIKKVADSVQNLSHKLEDFQDIVHKVWMGDFGNSDTGRFEKLEAAGWDHRVVQDLVNKGIDYKITMEDVEASHKKFGITLGKTDKEAKKTANTFGKLSDSQLRNAGLTEAEIRLYRQLEAESKRTGKSINELVDEMSKVDGRTLLIDSFKNVGRTLGSIFFSIKKAWSETFEPVSFIRVYSALETLKEKTRDIANFFAKNSDQLTRTFKGLFAIIDIITTLVGGGFKIAIKAISALLGMFDLNILDVTANVGDAIVAFRDWLDSVLDFTKIFEGMKRVFSKAVKGIKEWIETLKTSDNIPRDVINGIIKGLKFGLSVIGQAAKALGEKIIEGIKAGLEYFGIDTSFIDELIEKVRSWFDSFKDGDGIPQNIISGIANGFKSGASKVLSAVTEFVKGIIAKAKEILGIHSPSTVFLAIGAMCVAGLASGLIKGIPEAISAIKELTKKTVLETGKMPSKLDTTIEGLKIIGGRVLESFKEIFNNIYTFLKSVDPGTLIAVGLIATTLYVAKQLSDAIKILHTPLQGFSDMCGEIGNTFKALRKRISGNTFDKIALGIRRIAEAILIMAASVYLLAQLEYGKLWSAVGALVVLAGVLAALAFVVNKMDSVTAKFNITSIITIVAIAGGLLLAAMALNKLSEIDPEKIKPMLENLAIAIGSVALVFIAVSKASKTSKSGAVNDLNGIGKMLFKMALALLVVVIAIKMINKLDASEIDKGLSVITRIMLLFAGIVIASKFAGEHGKAAGKLLMKMSFALLVMVGVVKLASKLKNSEIDRGIKLIEKLELLFAAVIAVSLFAGENASKAGSMLLKMSFALIIAVACVKLAGSMDEEAANRGLRVVGILEAIFGVLIGVSHFAGKNASKAGVMLIAMSFALLIVVGIMYLLTKFDEEGLKRGLASISILEGLFAAIIYLSKSAKGVKPGTMWAMVGAIAILAIAVGVLSLIEKDKLKNSTECLSLLMAALAALVYSFKSLKDVKISKMVPVLLLVAVLAGIVWMLAELKPDTSIETAESLSILMASMAGVVAALSKFKIKAKNAAKGIALLTAMVIPLGAFAVVLQTIPDTSYSIGNIIALISVMAVMTLLIRRLTSIGAQWKNAAKGIALLTAMIIPLGAFVYALYYMDDAQNAINNAKALSMLIGVLTACLYPLRDIGGRDILGKSNLVKTIEGIGALTLLLVPLFGILELLTKMDDLQNSSKNLNALSEFMKTLAALLVILSIFGSFAAIATLAFDAALVVTGILATGIGVLFNKFEGLQDALETGLDVLAIVAEGIGKIVACLVTGFVDNLDLSNLESIGEDLSNFADAISPFIEFVEGIKESAVTGIAILVATVMRFTAADIINGIGKLFGLTGNLVAVGEQLSKFGVAVAPFLYICSIVPTSALVGAYALSKVILQFTIADLINGIGKLFGLTGNLVAVGKQLSKFGVSILPFIFITRCLNENDVEAASQLANLVLTLTKASLLNGIQKLMNVFGLGGSIDDFGPDLVKFGGYIKQFSDKVKNINPVSVVAAAICGALLTELSNRIPDDCDWLDKLLGNDDMDHFGKQIKVFAESMSKASKALVDNPIKQEAIQSLKSAGLLMTALASEIPSMHGSDASTTSFTVYGYIMGSNDLGEFGPKVEAFAESMSKASKTLVANPIKEEAFKSLKAAGLLMTALASEIPSMHGSDASTTSFTIYGFIMGSNDLGEFGSKVKAFADSMGKVSQELVKNPIDTEAITTVKRMGDLFVAFDKSIPTDKWFDGKVTLSKFGEEMVGYAESITDMSEELSGVNVGKLAVVAKIGVILGKLTDMVQKLDTSKLADFDITSLGTAIVNYYDEVDDINPDIISSATAAISSLITSINRMASLNTSGVANFKTAVSDLATTNFKDLQNTFKQASSQMVSSGVNIVDSIAKGIKTNSSSLSGAASSIINSINNSIKSKAVTFASTGQSIVKCIATGIVSKYSIVSTAAVGVISSSVGTVRDKYSSLYDAGSYLMKGLAKGISDNGYRAINEVKKISKAIKETANEVFGIASPSKVFYKIGNYLVQGFTNALDDGEDSVYSSVRKTFNSSIGKVMDVLSDDLDLQPTIRPVLDTSDVAAGARAITGMLDIAPSARTLSTIGSINSMMNSRIQNGNNDDVVSAINKLRNDIGNVGGTTNIVNGVTYDDGSNISNAVEAIVRAARIERRV